MSQGSLHAREALTPRGWRRDTRLAWKDGALIAVEPDVVPGLDEDRVAVAVPGLGNLHSHAFQRAMSGLAERRGTGDDNFWSWRETMYRFALSMDPDDVEAVAALAYVEMLEAGYTRVGEFHYLHHTPDGRRYDNIAELSQRICAAAAQSHIGMTLLPVFYAHSGFGGAAPGAAQRRFINDLDGFARLADGASHAVSTLDGGRLGLAPHSLRAATLEEIQHIAAMAEDSPLHVHIAEQTAEVDACLAFSGQRPVRYLLDRVDVDARWCLIHATHMDAEETRGLAVSGAVAGLCPITEANLGDGVFNAPEFLAAGGRLGVGTDSNVEITMSGEWRMLEYSQRLARRARNVLAPSGGSTARALFDTTLVGGARALGASRSGFEIGADADIVTLNANALNAERRAGDDILDAWTFSGGGFVDSVFARGRRVVRDGVHVERQGVVERFRATMRKRLAA